MRAVVAVVRSDDLFALLLRIKHTKVSHNNVALVCDDHHLHAPALLPQHLRQAVYLVYVQRSINLVRQENGTGLRISSSLLTHEHRVDRKHEGQQTQRLLPSGQPGVEGPRRMVQLALRSHRRTRLTRKETPSEKAAA